MAETPLPGGPPLSAPGRRWGFGGPEGVPPAVLLAMVLVIATTGLVYELVIAAVASYVLGDSVRQFSLVIGAYLSALGLGAYLSRFVTRHLSTAFVDVELGAALVGGTSAPMLFLAFGFTDAFRVVLYSVVVLTGTLVGLELPLLIRILERRLVFRELIARALTFDYAGALLGSIGFTFVLVPELGLSHGSLVSGLLNAAVALASTWLLPAADDSERKRLSGARVRAVAVLLLLIVAIITSTELTRRAEAETYPGRIVHAQHSAYQRIVVTEVPSGFELYLNGNLQFASRDEYRYHEALVHPAIAAAARRESVFVGGGGDGLAVREILRWPDVASVTLVDLDPAMTSLAREFAPLVRLNGDALRSPSVHVVNEDAMSFLARGTDRYDVIILDFPDPTTYSLGKLYSAEFYRVVRHRLAAHGVLAVQASSPFFGRRSYWCVISTIEAAGFQVRPYHAFVPSFGDWGFALARTEPFPVPAALDVPGPRFVTRELLPFLFSFPSDTSRVATATNHLDEPALVGYYLDEWNP